MSIQHNLEHIKKQIPEQVALVAVSKTKPISDILEAYSCGQRIFGENKIQEMVEKQKQLPNDIEWHAIGHIQRNKVKYMAEFVSLIHAVDSLKLLREINKQALRCNRTIDCLLQLKIANEDSKFGMSKQEISELIESKELDELKNIRIAGLMGMATFTNDAQQIKDEFATLKQTFDHLKHIELSNVKLHILSMGMSGDYKIAIDSGSTMIRVGSSIFGARNYH